MTNGTPMCNIIPKADRTASPAESTPNVATHTLFLTQSNLENRQNTFEYNLKNFSWLNTTDESLN